MTILPKSTAKAGAIASVILSIVGALAATNILLSRRANSDNPPEGDFIKVDGVMLHYVIRGDGPVVVLLHGNGSMIADFECSGLLGECAAHYRVIAFDRPGYGHSPRSSGTGMTPEAQADLIATALSRLGIRNAVVLGHSWGTLVALNLALRHGVTVKGLVLVSGYYFPTWRLDALVAAAGAVPGLGALLSYTVTPLIARLTWPAMVRNLFKPAQVPKRFSAFPREMALRPSQLRTSAEEAAMMVPSTKGLADKCSGLSVPVAIVCGGGDRVVSPLQSEKLGRRIFGASLAKIPSAGHMVHHTALAEVAAALAGIVRHTENPASELPQAS